MKTDNYNEQVESDFAKQQKRHDERKAMKKTDMRMVLQYMYDHPEIIWFWAWELNGKQTSKGDWLSHRGCARASDLAIHFDELVDSRKIGRFKLFRLRWENQDDVEKFIK